MLQSRRGFLIGAGSLLTTAFVKDARSFIRTNGRPLLAPPAQVVQTIYWYDRADDGHLLTLGEWRMDPPPAPTWREFFVKEGIRHQTDDEIEWICSEHLIAPEDFDDLVEERYWAQRFEIEDSPCARHIAYCTKLISDLISKPGSRHSSNSTSARIPATAATG